MDIEEVGGTLLFAEPLASAGPVTFEAGYNRKGIITVQEDTCARCGEHAACIYVDSSEDEYGPGLICLSCATKLILSFTEDPSRFPLYNS